MRKENRISFLLIIVITTSVFGQTLFEDHASYAPSMVDYGPLHAIFHEDHTKTGFSSSSDGVFEPFYFRFGELPDNWETDLKGYTLFSKFTSKKAKISDAEKKTISNSIELPESWSEERKKEFRSKLLSSESIAEAPGYNILIVFDVAGVNNKLLAAESSGRLQYQNIKIAGRKLFIINSFSTRDKLNGLYCLQISGERIVISNSKTLIIRSVAASKGEISSIVVDQEYREICDKLSKGCFRWRIEKMPYSMLNRLKELEYEDPGDDSKLRKLNRTKAEVEDGIHWSIESYLHERGEIQRRYKLYFGSEKGAKKHYDRLNLAKKQMVIDEGNAHNAMDSISINKETVEVVIKYDKKKIESHKRWYSKTREEMIKLRKQEQGDE